MFHVQVGEQLPGENWGMSRCYLFCLKLFFAPENMVSQKESNLPIIPFFQSLQMEEKEDELKMHLPGKNAVFSLQQACDQFRGDDHIFNRFFRFL